MRTFNMIYQNDVAKLYVKKTSEDEQIFCNIELLPITMLSIKEAKKTSIQLAEIYTLGEKISFLIEKNLLVDTVKSNSYVRESEGLFTPFCCLEQFYCLGICHATGVLKIVNYGELFNEYAPVDRNNSMVKTFNSLIVNSKNFTKTNILNKN